MSELFFFLAALGALVGAVGVATLRNAFYAVLALVCHLVALAMLFLLLRAEFVAAAQVVVYAGAVMVLYVFVVAYVGGSGEPLTASTGASLRFASILFALALFVELTIALVGTGLSALETEGAGYQAGFGTPAEVGELFLTRFLVAFEIASMLLLIAAVGAVILARRRAGLGDTGEVSVADVMRRPEVTAGHATPGSMIEAAGPPQR
jgi:NADH:ubiquinone oxidoreductase subunit 6 (subunit J)